MRFNFKKVALMAMAASLTFAGVAVAEYPEKPVRFIVPWSPGDLEDRLARMIAEDFQEKYGAPLVPTKVSLAHAETAGFGLPFMGI